MQGLLRNRNRCILGSLIAACILGGLVPFLNIDLKVVILTPIRWVSILASAYCLAIWWIRFRKKQAAGILRRHKMEWLTFAFLVIWGVTAMGWLLLGANSALAPTEVMGILVICMIAFCVFTLTQTREDALFLMRFVVLCGLILAILGCVEVVIGSFVPGTRYYFTLEDRIAMGRTLYAPTTVFYNPNDFAAFLQLCLAIVCYLLVQANSKKEFAMYMAAGVLLTIPALLATSTLFNLTAGLLAALTAIALLLKRQGSVRGRIVKSAIVVLMALAFVFVLSDAAKGAAKQLNKAYFAARISAAQEPDTTPDTAPEVTPDATQDQDAPEAPSKPKKPAASSELENSLSLSEQVAAAKWGYGTIHIRWYLIRAGWAFFLEKPMTGHGPGGFQEAMRDNPFYLEHTNSIVDPHCFFTELLAEYGGILFAMYMAIILWIMVASCVLSLKELRKGKSGRGLFCLLLLGAFCVASVMPSSMVRQTPLWIGFVLTVSVFSKMRPLQDPE